MSFRIDVKGLKEAQGMIENIQRGLEPHVFNDWASRVSRSAKIICNDPECKRIKFRHTEKLGFEYTFADTEAIDCVIKAINQLSPSMPMVLKDLYLRVISDLENRKKDFKPST